MFSFGGGKAAATKEEDTKDLIKKWTREIKEQSRGMDRQVREIQREQDKIKRDAKVAAKKNETSVLKSMAKNIVMSRKAIERIEMTKAQLNSVALSLQTHGAMSKVASTLTKSTAIMKSMSALIKAPELAGTMRKMGEEMAKAGIIDSMLGDAMDAAAPEGFDEEVDEVVEQAMWEITAGLMGKAPTALSGGLSAHADGVRAGAGAAAAPARTAVAAGGAGAGDDVDAAHRDRLDKM